MAEELLWSIRASVSILKSYDPLAPQTLEEFIGDHLSSKRISDEYFALTLKIASGCIENMKIIRSVVEPFCQQTKSAILKRDRELFKVVTYILLFSPKKYPTETMQSALLKLYTFSVRKFLLFFMGLDSECKYSPVHTVIRKNWYSEFDRDFINSTVYKDFREHEAYLKELITSVEAASNPDPAKKPEVAPKTKTRPFRLRTSERSLAELQRKSSSAPAESEQAISSVQPSFHAHRIPATTYKPSAGTLHYLTKTVEHEELLKSSKWRIQRREEQRKELKRRGGRPPSEPEPNPHFLATHLQELTAEIEKPKPLQSKKTRKKVGNPARPVKQTVAALLREKALFERKKKEDEDRLNYLATGGFDAEEYAARIRKFEEKELEMAIRDTERKVISAMMALENAINARKTYEDNAKQKALSEKELQREFREQRQFEMEREIQDLRAAVEQAQEISRAQLREAKRRLGEEKKRKAQEVKEENNDLYHRYMDQCEEEMNRKKEIIAQIRDMEARLATYERTFDFGEMQNKYGFLTDMSLADLKDRLIGLRFLMIEENEKKRKKIVDDREQMRENLRQAREFVDAERPQWQQMKREEVARARKFKEIRENSGTFPGIRSTREALLQKSQLRRKERIAERESRLNVKDLAWEQYEFV